MTDFRLTGVAAADPQFVGLDNYRAALTDPAFHNSLWLTIVVRLRVGDRRPEHPRVRSSRGRCARSAKAVKRDRRDARAAGVDPAQLGRRVPLGRVADRDGGTLSDDAQHARTRRGCSSTRWRRSSSSTSGAARRSRCCCTRRRSAPCRRRSWRRPGWPARPRWQQFRDVVFPHIRGHVLTNTLLISLWTFNDFTPFLLTAGGPDHATEIAAGVHLPARALRRRARLRRRRSRSSCC